RRPSLRRAARSPQAQPPARDHELLDLGRPAGDRRADARAVERGSPAVERRIRIAVAEPVEPEEVDPPAREALREPRARALGPRPRRPRRLAPVEQVRSPEGQEPRSRQLTSQPCNSPPRIAVEAFDGDQALLERVDEPCERTDLLGGDALEVERPHEDLPTAVQLA